MKKTVKIMSTILLTIMLVATIAGTAFAEPDFNGLINDMSNGGNINTGTVSTIGANIVTVVQVVGVVVAIVIILVIGIKYMVGSAEEKAEYKKTMIPYLVGAALIFAGTQIVRVIYSVTTQIKA